MQRNRSLDTVLQIQLFRVIRYVIIFKKRPELHSKLNTSISYFAPKFSEVNCVYFVWDEHRITFTVIICISSIRVCIMQKASIKRYIPWLDATFITGRMRVAKYNNRNAREEFGNSKSLLNSTRLSIVHLVGLCSLCCVLHGSLLLNLYNEIFIF